MQNPRFYQEFLCVQLGDKQGEPLVWGYKYFAYRPIFLLKLNKKFSIIWTKVGEMKKTIRYFPISFVKNTIKILRKSESKETACLKLKEKYLLNDKQVEYIMRYSFKKLIEEMPREYKDFINGLVLLD